MDIVEQITETAIEKFGITAIKPYQLLVMVRILEQDADRSNIENQLVILPTGTGKSLCFLLPSLLCRGLTIIVYPLLALMNDQTSKLKANGIVFADLRGGQTKAQRKSMFDLLKSGKTKLVITNPETLLQQSIINELKKLEISLFVCDEAHVVKWGESFRPAYYMLKNAIDLLKPLQILAFTATASEDTTKEIIKYLFTIKPLVIRGDIDRENIEYCSYPVADRTLGLVKILSECKKPALVFCRTRREAYYACLECMRVLHCSDFRYYHAGLSKEERRMLENWFLQSRDGVLFATCAYGMGVDKSDIRTVIHYSLPSCTEDYLQESGRAGRDGEKAFAYAFISPEDRTMNNKSSLINAFTGEKCRRQALLESMGQIKTDCTGCDICNNSTEKESYEETVISKLIKHYPFRYTAETAADLLCAYSTKDCYNPLFGALESYDRTLVKNAVDLMTEGKFRNRIYKVTK